MQESRKEDHQSPSSQGSSKKRKVSFGGSEASSGADSSFKTQISLGSDDSIGSLSSLELGSDSEEEEEEEEEIISVLKKRPESPAERSLSSLVNRMDINKAMKKTTKKAVDTKKKKITTSKKSGDISISLPSFFYVWKDARRNRLVTYEIHLPSASTGEEVGMTLIDDPSGGSQTLRVSVKFSELFLNQDFFKDVCQIMDPGDSTNRFSARADRLLSLRNMHSKAGEETVNSSEDFKLPFRSDNFFNLPIGERPYPNTGFEFRAIPIKDRLTKAKDSEMLILLVTFVEEEKQITQASTNTPSKKSTTKEFIR